MQPFDSTMKGRKDTPLSAQTRRYLLFLRCVDLPKCVEWDGRGWWNRGWLHEQKVAERDPESQERIEQGTHQLKEDQELQYSSLGNKSVDNKFMYCTFLSSTSGSLSATFCS